MNLRYLPGETIIHGGNGWHIGITANGAGRPGKGSRIGCAHGSHGGIRGGYLRPCGQGRVVVYPYGIGTGGIYHIGHFYGIRLVVGQIRIDIEVGIAVHIGDDQLLARSGESIGIPQTKAHRIPTGKAVGDIKGSSRRSIGISQPSLCQTSIQQLQLAAVSLINLR